MPTLNILLVEDSIDDTELLRYELKRAGYTVSLERVETANAMQTALSTSQWDIVISDFYMPNFSGETALRLLQESGKDIPFIMLSGAIGEERAVEIMRAGANDYVMKDNIQRLIPAIERELREADERARRRKAEGQVLKLSRALQQSASLVMITDTQGVIEYVNQAFSDVTGYSYEEIIGVHTRILKSGTTDTPVYEDLWRTILSGASWRGEIQNRKKNGDLFWVKIVISAIRGDGGEIIQFLAVQEDVSERKRLEAELQRYNDQLQRMVAERTHALEVAKEEIELILNNTTDAIALAMPNGDVRQRNVTFELVFGESVANNIEQMLDTVAYEDQMEQVSRAILQVIYDNEVTQIQSQIRRKDGGTYDVDLSFIPVDLDSANGMTPAGFLVCAHDITQMKEMERFKAQFVADAVHDLATPISGLVTRLYLLKKAPEKANLHISALENQVEHLSSLLNDLRTLSQLDRGQFTLELEQANLNDLVVRVFDTYEPVAINRNQTLTLTIDPDLPATSLDVRRMERVIVNLISNAIRYTAEGKSIAIWTAVEQDALVFSVEDQGIGIDAGDVSRIFERFYRTDAARQTQSGGTGLGLAISKEIVEMHHGEISVTSEPGKGSVFVVRLPRGN